ncbi:MAG: formylglycine-generating enzyme family protein [Proteobacteria bacterium]|nr:formylglycine-generating enzyme family protein [Pseudomonadota bacterium]
MRRVFVGLLVILSSVTGCFQSTRPTEDADDGGDTGSDGDADTDTDGDIDTDTGDTCLDTCPNDMVFIPGHCACVDSHEYTNEEMVDFLNDRGNNQCGEFECRPTKWPQEWPANEEGLIIPHFINPLEWLAGEDREIVEQKSLHELDGGVFTVEPGFEHFPVTYVSWFGADEACKAEGKTLCSKELFYEACSHGGEWHYPYGGTKGGVESKVGYIEDYKKYACASVIPGLVEIGIFETCEGGYPGLFDMVGNAGEWGAKTSETQVWSRLGESYRKWDCFETEGDGETCKIEMYPGCKFMSGWTVGPWLGSESDGFRCCLLLDEQ